MYIAFPDLRNTFVVTMMYIVCTAVAPILWHLWIYAGSANANFYFAITLVYSTAQVGHKYHFGDSIHVCVNVLCE